MFSQNFCKETKRKFPPTAPKRVNAATIGPESQNVPKSGFIYLFIHRWLTNLFAFFISFNNINCILQTEIFSTCCWLPDRNNSVCCNFYDLTFFFKWLMLDCHGLCTHNTIWSPQGERHSAKRCSGSWRWKQERSFRHRFNLICAPLSTGPGDGFLPVAWLFKLLWNHKSKGTRHFRGGGVERNRQ